MCTDRDVIAGYAAAEDAYFTWLDDVTDQLRDLGADPAQVRAFYSYDGFTTVSVPHIEPAPPGWVVRADGTTMVPAPGAAGGDARAWLTRWATHADPIRALVAHGLPQMTYSPAGPFADADSYGRPVEHVFDDVAVVSTGARDQFVTVAGPLWTPIPQGLFEAILAEHDEHDGRATAVA